MNAKELRAKLFAELETISKEDMIRELEEAGFIIRYDLEGSGVLDPDENPIIHDSDIGKKVVYSTNGDYRYPVYSHFQNLSLAMGRQIYGNPNNTKYSISSQWIESEDLKQWTSSPNSNLRKAS